MFFCFLVAHIVLFVFIYTDFPGRKITTSLCIVLMVVRVGAFTGRRRRGSPGVSVGHMWPASSYEPGTMNVAQLCLRELTILWRSAVTSSATLPNHPQYHASCNCPFIPGTWWCWLVFSLVDRSCMMSRKMTVSMFSPSIYNRNQSPIFDLRTITSMASRFTNLCVEGAKQKIHLKTLIYKTKMYCAYLNRNLSR